jgi:hypothetical protein
MNAIPTRIHAVIDYVMAVVLIVTPFVFMFEEHEAAKWVLIYIGIITFVASLLTHDELGIAWAIPMPGHLALDIVLGLFLIASPWLLGFADTIWLPHVILGAIKVLVALGTRWHPGRGHAGPPSRPQIAGQH